MDKNVLVKDSSSPRMTEQPEKNLQNLKGTPDSLKLRLKGFERKLSLGAPE